MRISTILMLAAVLPANGQTTTGLNDDVHAAVAWLSHVFFGIAALVFLLGGLPLIFDPAGNFPMIAQIDSALENIKTKDDAYNAFKNCTDKQVKHLAFWCLTMLRSFGSFQTFAGIGLILVVSDFP